MSKAGWTSASPSVFHAESNEHAVFTKARPKNKVQEVKQSRIYVLKAKIHDAKIKMRNSLWRVKSERTTWSKKVKKENPDSVHDPVHLYTMKQEDIRSPETNMSLQRSPHVIAAGGVHLAGFSLS